MGRAKLSLPLLAWALILGACVEDEMPAAVGAASDAGANAGGFSDGSLDEAVPAPYLVSAVASAREVRLQWLPPPRRPARYEVLASSEMKLETDQTSAVVFGLEPETLYVFTVVAIDPQGRRSPPSEPLKLTTIRNPAALRPEIVAVQAPASLGSTPRPTLEIAALGEGVTHLVFDLAQVSSGWPSVARIVERSPTEDGVLVELAKARIEQLLEPPFQLRVAVRDLENASAAAWQRGQDGYETRSYVDLENGLFVQERAAPSAEARFTATSPYQWNRSFALPALELPPARAQLSGRVRLEGQITLSVVSQEDAVATTAEVDGRWLGRIDYRVETTETQVFRLPTTLLFERTLGRQLGSLGPIPIVVRILARGTLEGDLSASGGLGASASVEREGRYGGTVEVVDFSAPEVEWTVEPPTSGLDFDIETTSAELTGDLALNLQVGGELDLAVELGTSLQSSFTSRLEGGFCAGALRMTGLSADVSLDFGVYGAVSQLLDGRELFRASVLSRSETLLEWPDFGVHSKDCQIELCIAPGQDALPEGQVTWRTSSETLGLATDGQGRGSASPPLDGVPRSHSVGADLAREAFGFSSTLCLELQLHTEDETCLPVEEGCRQEEEDLDAGISDLSDANLDAGTPDAGLDGGQLDCGPPSGDPVPPVQRRREENCRAIGKCSSSTATDNALCWLVGTSSTSFGPDDCLCALDEDCYTMTVANREADVPILGICCPAVARSRQQSVHLWNCPFGYVRRENLGGGGPTGADNILTCLRTQKISMADGAIQIPQDMCVAPTM